jgi:hypothetical protein
MGIKRLVIKVSASVDISQRFKDHSNQKKIEKKTYASSAMTSFSLLLLAFIFCVGIGNLKARYLLVEVDQAAEVLSRTVSK